MLRKQLISLFMVVFFGLGIATGAIAATRHHGPMSSRAVHAPFASVYFFPQDAEIPSVMFRFDSWGLMSYRLWGKDFHFFFKGYNLERRTHYALIYYPGPEGGTDMIRLGTARSNRRGQLNISARLNICSLPDTTDPNYFYGAQLMLVPLNGEGELLPLEGMGNLMSYHAIRFTNTEGCPFDDDETLSDGVEEPGGTGEEDQEPEGDSDGNTGGSLAPADHPGDTGNPADLY